MSGALLYLRRERNRVPCTQHRPEQPHDMTPNFALSLSFDGIRLLHRATDGWRDVGDVALDVPDLGAALAELRDQALSLSPDHLACKLIIPNDQIRYLSIDTNGLDEEAGQVAARAALDGATPYAVDDLAFDTSTDGDTTYIAAVAFETLGEAHAFAQEHHFNPLTAVAIADPDTFVGEPFFGATGGQTGVTRHDDPAVSIGPMSAAPAPAPEPAPEPALEPPVEPDAKDVPAPDDIAPETPQESPPVAGADVPAAATDDAVETSQRPDSKDADDTPAAEAAPSIGFASRRGDSTPKAPALSGAERPTTAPKSATPLAAPATPARATPETKVRKADVTSPNLQIEEEAPEPIAVATPAAAKSYLSRRKVAKPEPAAPSKAKAVATAPSSEAQRLTVFGARKAEPVIGGKPRFLGLMLTTVLLVFLAGVAAWASVFLDDGLASRLFGTKPQTETARLPDGVAPEEAPPEDIAPPVVTASLDPTLSAEDAAVLDALQDPMPEPLVNLPPLTLAEQEARYAVTGIWPIAPQTPEAPAQITLDDLYITSIDPLSPSKDAVALPTPKGVTTDDALNAQSAPAAAGTTFALDDRGLVVPTSSGAVTPDGITVYLGRPALVPPARPEAPAAPEVIDPNIALLAALRPKVRPDDLTETNERSQLGGATLSELASLRPKLRPAGLAPVPVPEAVPEPAPEEPVVAEAPDVETVPEVETVEDPSASATRLAVAASIRPDLRPRNFKRLYDRAQRTQEEDTQQAPTRVAAVAPRVVVPPIPSASSVAKQATVRNAIRLGQVNLIGVTGKPSARRALVRLPSGRIQRVKVGDRIDGGRVSAIGEGELLYKKGSRNLVLKLPKG